MGNTNLRPINSATCNCSYIDIVVAKTEVRGIGRFYINDVAMMLNSERSKHA